MGINIIKKNPTAGEITSSLTGSNDAPGLHFDGTAGNIDIASPPDLGTKFSFEFIIQADEWGSSADYLIDFGTGGRFLFYAEGSTSYNLAIWDTGLRTFGVKVLDDLKVHHLVLTVDGTAAILYDNGNQVGTTTLGASSDIDSCTDARIGARFNADAGYFFNGTLYRTRFWNKTLTAAEVTASYENATVPVAEQSSVQAELVTGGDFASSSGWTLGTGWSIGSGKATSDGSQSSTSNLYRTSAVTEKVGKTYRVTFTVSSRTAGEVWVNIGGNKNTTKRSTNGTFTEVIETRVSVDNNIYIQADADFVGSIDDVSITQSGNVADFDLAFSNPSQSLLIQDRAGNADGTASATGVSQVTKLEQVNSKAISVSNATQRTPANGDIVADQIGVGIVPTVPLDISSGGMSVIIGADTDATTRTNSTRKRARLAFPHFTNAEEPIGGLYLDSVDATTSNVAIGGGSSSLNAATAIKFYTAANATTTTGTERLTIDSAGLLTSTQAAAADLPASFTIDQKRPSASGSEGSSILFKLRPGSAASTVDTARIVAKMTNNADADGRGKLVFQTMGASNAAPTDRLTIDHLGVITTDAAAGSGYVAHKDGGTLTGYVGSGLGLAASPNNANTDLVNRAVGKLVFCTSNSNVAKMVIDTAGSITATAASAGGWSMTTGNTSATGWGMQVKGGADSGDRSFEVQSQAGAQLLLVDGGGLTTVAAITETNGVLRSNLLTNSGFDVWSNSTLVSATTGAAPSSEDAGDLIHAGTANSGTAWTGATGTTAPNGWTARSLSGSGTEAFTITGSGQAGNCIDITRTSGLVGIEDAITTVVGKLYKLTYWQKNNSGGGRVKVTTGTYWGGTVHYDSGDISNVGWTEYTAVFEATTTTTYIGLAHAAGSATQFDTVSVHEVVPGCVAADNLSFDGTRKTHSVVDMWRQHNDGGTLTHDGSFYSLKMVTSIATTGFCWPASAGVTTGADPVHLQKFAGRTVTMGAWVKTDQASNAKIRMTKDAYSTDTSSAYHTGDNNWQWLEATMDCTATPTNIQFGFQMDGAGDGSATSNNLTYVSQPMLVFGSAIGEGNYSAPSGEIVWCEVAVGIQTNVSPAAADDKILNLEALSNGKIPKGAQSVNLRASVRNSSVTSSQGVEYGPSSSYSEFLAVLPSVNGFTTNAVAWVDCDSNGDIYQKVTEADATLAGLYNTVKAVQLR